MQSELYTQGPEELDRLTCFYFTSTELFVCHSCRSRARAAEAGGPNMLPPVGMEQPDPNVGRQQHASQH